MISQHCAWEQFRPRHATVEPGGWQRDEQMPPGTLEIERELVPAVSNEDIAASQGNRFAATRDSSLAFKVHAGGIDVTARASNVRACMHRMHTPPGDLRDSEFSNDSGLDLAVQRHLAHWLDPHGCDVTADEVCPELRTLARRDTVGRH